MDKVFEEICVEETSTLTQEKLKILGKNIRKLRIKNKLTQFDVAVYIFSDTSLISALERGVYKNTTYHTIIKLATLFEVSINDLLE